MCVDYQMYPQPLPKYEGWLGGSYVPEESQEEVAEFQENEPKPDNSQGLVCIILDFFSFMIKYHSHSFFLFFLLTENLFILSNIY